MKIKSVPKELLRWVKIILIPTILICFFLDVVETKSVGSAGWGLMALLWILETIPEPEHTKLFILVQEDAITGNYLPVMVTDEESVADRWKKIKLPDPIIHTVFEFSDKNKLIEIGMFYPSNEQIKRFINSYRK